LSGVPGERRVKNLGHWYEIDRIVLDSESAIGPLQMPVLRAIGARAPIDLFAVDYDVDDAGRVVLFEAQSTMGFLPHGNAP